MADQYDTEEYVVKILGSAREIRCPAYPAPCSYVRVVEAGRGEIAYWDSDEWREDPMGVMGAILGASGEK